MQDAAIEMPEAPPGPALYNEKASFQRIVNPENSDCCARGVSSVKAATHCLKASAPGKFAMALLVLVTSYDMYTDVRIGIDFVRTRNWWWGSITFAVIYLTLRFQFLFHLSYGSTFLGAENIPCTKTAFKVITISSWLPALFLLVVPGTYLGLLLQHQMKVSKINVGLSARFVCVRLYFDLIRVW